MNNVPNEKKKKTSLQLNAVMLPFTLIFCKDIGNPILKGCVLQPLESYLSKLLAQIG